MRTFLVAVALLMLTPMAHADMARLSNRGEKVPLSEITTISQRDGESRESFLMRLGTWLNNYTTGTNEEVCGDMAQSPEGTLSVRLTTNHSHLACGLTGRVVAGSTATGDSIHSHPVDERFKINDADRAFMRDRIGGGQVARRANFDAEGRDFSPQDYAGGSGYLVAHGKLLYQNGHGTSRVVAELPAPGTTP